MRPIVMLIAFMLASSASAQQTYAPMPCAVYNDALKRSPDTAKAWAEGFYFGVTQTMIAYGAPVYASKGAAPTFADVIARRCEDYSNYSFNNVVFEVMHGRLGGRQPPTPRGPE